MNISKQVFLTISIIIGLVFTQVNMGKPKSVENVSKDEVSCKEALQNVYKIKVGMEQSEALALLGSPKTVENDVWSYSFFECAPPPQAGTQSVIGLGITFKDKIITKIDYATICATGPGN